MPSVFRSFAWDPILILAQIVTLQSLFYLSYGFLVYLFESAWIGNLVTLSLIFDHQRFNSSHWYLLGAMLVNSLFISLAVWKIVQRAKLCIDFAATCHIVHLIFCSLYAGFPLSWLWWTGNLIGFSITAILGEYLCMKTDLAPVAIHLTRSN